MSQSATEDPAAVLQFDPDIRDVTLTRHNAGATSGSFIAPVVAQTLSNGQYQELFSNARNHDPTAGYELRTYQFDVGAGNHISLDLLVRRLKHDILARVLVFRHGATFEYRPDLSQIHVTWELST